MSEENFSRLFRYESFPTSFIDIIVIIGKVLIFLQLPLILIRIIVIVNKKNKKISKIDF